MPNLTHAVSTELIEIEPPVFLATSEYWQDLSWITWGAFSLLIVIGIACLIGLFIWRNHLYRPAYLYWKLTHISPKNTSQNRSTVSRQQAYALYQYCLEMQTLHDTSPSFKAELSSLIEQIKPLCFAKQEV